MKTFKDFESDVAEALKGARAIAWDECHKIYILKDEAQLQKIIGYKYPEIVTSEQLDEEQMLIQLNEWWDESCSLRLVNSIESGEHGSDIFNQIIAQFDDEEEEGEEE